MADDVGSSDVSFYSRLMRPNVPPPILTPALDSLASNGSVFSRYFTSPLCGPSRSAFLTGRSAYTFGNAFSMENGGGLAPEFNTIAGMR